MNPDATKNAPSGINTSVSFLLDACRILAALIVLVFHAYEQWFPKLCSADSVIAKSAHTAVVVFFVISGYVIAFSTSAFNRGALQYANARLTKLSSIVIPALIVTAICQIAIYFLNKDLYVTYTRSHSFIRYLISGLFSNELWFNSSAPPLNSPLWSLSFEFWYYAIFGFWFYSKKGITRVLFTIITCLIAGPKILLLMPIWIFGCLAFTVPPIALSNSKKLLFASVLFLLGLISTFSLPLYPYKISGEHFYFANQFVTDWIVGICFGTALWLISKVQFFKISKDFLKSFRKFADLTFPIYVLHFPLLVLWQSIVGTYTSNFFHVWLAIVGVLIVSSLLGLLFESQRKIWLLLFTRILITVKRAKMLLQAFLLRKPSSVS